MAEVLFHCPICTGMLAVDSSLAGGQVACPTCQGIVTIPLLEQPAAPPYAPPPETDSPISLNCPLCTGLFQVLTSSQGQQVSCPHCAGVIQVPVFDSIPGAPPAPPSPYEPPAPAFVPPGFTPPNFGGFPTGSSAPEVPAAPPEPTWAPRPLFPSAPQPADSPASPAPQFRVETPATNRPVPLSDPRSSGANRPIPVMPAPAVPPPAVSLPNFEAAPKKSPAKSRSAETVALLPTEDGQAVALHDPVKTVGKPGQEIELRQLSPEEKAKRRVTRNIVMVTGSLLLLTIVMVVLINLR